MNIYYKVPISYYHLYLRKGSKDGIEFTKKKLNLYKNWKRQVVLWALNLRLLPTKKINSKADIIFFGNRKKEFYFESKKIITHGDCKKDFETRKKMNEYFNCIKNPKYSKEKLEEDIIWPTKDINKGDLIKLFNKLISYYQKNINSKHIANMHGDLWKGNIEKDINGNIWIFDWDFSKKRMLFWDFINYFYVEYSFTKIINKNLINKVKNIFYKYYKSDKEQFNKEIALSFDEYISERLPNEREDILLLKKNFI